MLSDDEIIQLAIEEHKGKRPPIGTIVAHESDPIAYELIRYEGDTAITSGANGEEKAFPASEIFDANAVKKTAADMVTNNLLSMLGDAVEVVA